MKHRLWWLVFSPWFGVAFIVLSCLVMEQIAEYQATQKTMNQLRLLVSLKKVSLTDYFDSIDAELQSASANRDIQTSMVKLDQVWNQMTETERLQLHGLFQQVRTANEVKQAFLDMQKKQDAWHYDNHLKYSKNADKNGQNVVTQAWSGAYDTSPHLRSKISPEMQSYLDYFAKFDVYGKRFMEHFQYYDVFLITMAGDIVYTYAREDDFGTNLLTGPYADTDLAAAFKQARKSSNRQLRYTHFAPYGPSAKALSTFTALPIFQDGIKVGVMALQLSSAMPAKVIEASLSADTAVESFLVDDQHLVITQTKRDDAVEKPNDETVKMLKRHDENVQLGLANKKGIRVAKNHLGQLVFSAFMPFRCKDKHWVLLTEKPVADVLQPIRIWWLLATAIGLAIFGLVYWAITRLENKTREPLIITTDEGAD